jgi:transposase
VARHTKYPSEFKVEAVALVKSSGRSIADVARSLGVSDRTLWYWGSRIVSAARSR